MKSLHARLDPIKEEVIRATETFGRFKAMHEFKVADYPAYCNWLKEVTNNENFGLNPKISCNGFQTLGDQLVEAFLHKIAHLEAERKRLTDRIKLLEWQTSLDDQKIHRQALAILDTCKV